MNNNVNTGIYYCGLAKLKVLRNNKQLRTYRFHNTGTDVLFTALAASLCGQDQSRNMPQYFDLGRSDENGDYEPAINTRVQLTSKFVNNWSDTDENTGKVTSAKVAAVFTAYIPSRLIGNDGSINKLCMYSRYTDNNRESLLAEITLSNDATLSASDVYSYMVEWAMTFQNVVTTKEVGGDK